MKGSSVKVKGLTVIQANALAITAERGDLAKFLNGYLLANNQSKERFELDSYAEVIYDNDRGEVNHEVNFD